MIRAHTVEQVREAERALMARLPEGTLMQRASYGLATAVADLLGSTYGRRVLLLVGSGDNGGDALYAGAVLARRGAHVEAWLLGSGAHEGGLGALRAAGGRVTDAPRNRPDVVLDGIVGIGGRAGLEPEAQAALKLLYGVPLVAVDTPSGVDVETGEVPEDQAEYAHADLTVTFGTHKPCHLLDPAAQAAGAVQLVDIGLELPEPAIEALQQEDVVERLPRPGLESQKYARGVVGVRAGSAQYPGAGLLSVGGASCGLAGMVRYVGDDAVAQTIKQQHPEVVGAGRVQAWVVGSGTGDDAEGTLREALEDGDSSLIVDADALRFVPERAAQPMVLTPHAGELAGMLDVERAEVEARPFHFAHHAAERWGQVVLLKGRRTVVATPDGRTSVNLTGTSWLATAGAGDVLGGVIGALLASGLDPYDAARVGAWLHGAAATLAGDDGPIVAGDVVRALPQLLRRLRPST